MSQSINYIMQWGQGDDRYTLEGMIEMGESYFTIEASQKFSLDWSMDGIKR